MPAICRDCEFRFEPDSRCPSCRSPRIVRHEELESLSIAHLDCDAFYAAVEKRDNPALRGRPVLVGGRRRGVVSTACYIARIYGVHSAMPMFQALKLCPDAVVIRPRMRAYAEAARKIRGMMLELTPDVEPLSFDEAFLDLSGTSRLHGAPPATLMVRLADRIERDIGLTCSIGLSHNKFLAKMASDLDKPRGFSVIGKAETESFLAEKPVGLIWGVGPALQGQMRRAGIVTFGDLRKWKPDALSAKFGETGIRLWKLSRGKDARPVTRRPMKSMSNETTFERDISDPAILDGFLWRLSVKVADRAKAERVEGRVVTLKLKQRNFRVITRRRTLKSPTFLTDRIYGTARELLEGELRKAPFRLIGAGISELRPAADEAGRAGLDPDSARRIAAETASDQLRQRFGKGIIFKGRSLR